MMVIPTPQKSMTETTASFHFLHSPYGLMRRMASNKLFVRLSVERRLGFSALWQGPHRRGRFEPTGVIPASPLSAATRHHCAAGPSVGTRFLDNLLAFAPCPAANGTGASAFRGGRWVRTSSGLN
jgi:hypothetical protein